MSHDVSSQASAGRMMAAAKLNLLPATMRNMHGVRQWRERIRAAQRGA